MNKKPIQKEEVKTATEMMVNDMQEEEYYRIKHTPSDTFVEENKLRDEWLNYIYNELFSAMSLARKETIATWWIDKLKSSLQEQRQSILEEIEKKIDDMGFIQPEQAGQFGLHASGYNQALEDIKQLLK